MINKSKKISNNKLLDLLFYLELPNDHQILNKYLKPAFSKSFLAGLKKSPAPVSKLSLFIFNSTNHHK